MAQICVWNGVTLTLENSQTWYWTGDTVVNSVARGDVINDSKVEIVLGDRYSDGAREVAQLYFWNAQIWRWKMLKPGTEQVPHSFILMQLVMWMAILQQRLLQAAATVISHAMLLNYAFGLGNMLTRARLVADSVEK